MMGHREGEKILEKDAAIARLVLVFPARAAFVPIFEGFFQVKLDRVDKLAVAAFDHHLVPTKIGSGEQTKTLRYAIQLQTMILPNAQHASLLRVVQEALSRAVDSAKDRIMRVGNADKAILVFEWAILALLVLLEPIERHHAGAKAQADKLVSPANCQNRDRVGANKFGERLDDGGIVIVEITKSAAQDYCIGLKLPGRNRDGRQRRHLRGRGFHKPLDVAENILDHHPGNAPLAFDLYGGGIAPVGSRYVREIVLIAE